MSDIETRIQGVTMLVAVAFPVLGAAMAWSTITGRCRWINRCGRAVIGTLAVLLAVASVAIVGIVVASAVRMIVVGA